jgi:4-hydroxy-tetrahydrodipicolinate synthase
LDAREHLHIEGMQKQIQAQIGAGVDALLVLGSMGAMQLLKDETFNEALEVTMEEVDGRLPVIVGCGDTSTERSLTRIRRAEQHAVSGVALVPPFFFTFTPDELLHYFTELALATELPVYLYGNPAWTKHTLSFELIVELSKVDNIVGLKESGDLNTVRRCADYFRSSPGFSVLSGLTPFFDFSLQAGADGIVDGLFALAPEYAVELVTCFRSGEPEGVAAAQRKIARLVAVVTVDSVFGGFTAAMNLRGIPGEFAPRPFTKITPEGHEKVRSILEELELPLV